MAHTLRFTQIRKENTMSIFTPISTYIFESLTLGENGVSNARLCARKCGFFAWLVKLLNRREGSGLVLDVYDDRVVSNSGWRHIIPARHIANVCYGYTCNFFLLLLILTCGFGALYCVASSIGVSFMCLVFAAIFFYFYLRSRMFIVKIIASSGERIAFRLKRSDFGGASLPDDDIAEMMGMIEKIALHQT